MIRSLSLLLLANAFGQIAAYDYDCPSAGEHISVQPGLVSIANSANNGLCTLTTVTALGDLVAIARSYDGGDWEASAGPNAASLSISGCDGNGCTVDVSGISTEMKLTSYAAYLDPNNAKDQKSMVAKFLEQATFGPTKADLDSWEYGKFEDSFKEWVSAQIEEDVSSHREFYRERTNPRMDQVYFSGKGGPGPCEKNSRWRTFAFATKDTVRYNTFKVVSIGESTSGPYVAMINDYPRAVLSSLELEGGSALSPGQVYSLCHPRYDFWKDGLGAAFKIRVGSACINLKDGNPKVDMSALEKADGHEYTLNVIDMTKAKFKSIDEKQHESTFWPDNTTGDEFILEEAFASDACAELPKPFSEDGSPVAPVFMKRLHEADGTFEYMVYDPRLELVENTVDNPTPDGGGQAVLDTDGAMKCANAPRTFLNEDNCVLSYADNACSPEAPAINTVTLDTKFLKEVDTMTNTNFYAFVGMPLAADYYLDWRNRKRYYLGWSACHRGHYQWSRFKSVDASMCEGDAYRSVTAKTEAIYARLLSPEWEDPHNPNPTYRDTLRRRKEDCDVPDYYKWDLGLIKQNQTCWQHVHPMEGNIYDMTKWFTQADTMAIEFAEYGGRLPINEWAVDDGAVLSVPPEQGNKWFYDVINKNRWKHFRQLAKLDDVIKFRDLPNHIETAEVEAAFGEFAVNNGKKGVVVCGSVGEVANKPELGNGFEWPGWWGFDDRRDASPFIGRQKHTVWTLLALNAKDQLRQRVAFALSQILVVAPSALGDPHTEASLQYYDIFVRNAFGSYRDIMKEVSFSEKMARMLSSVRNKSYQYNLSRRRPAFPDENFAREIMQLFSIGLFKLNMDGSEVLDGDGNVIENYDSGDLMSYSRAWTGLEWQHYRANTDALSSRVDPMRVVWQWHDFFPKSDLLGGYIGDRHYPLCIDLPDKHFTKAGATYRLLGSRSRPEMLEDPWWWEDRASLKRMELAEDSPLYEKLCGGKKADGSCNFKGKVVLDEDLVYSGTEYAELNVDSLRAVKVQFGEVPIYYEYVRQPCVEQTFYHNAKKVEDYTRGRWHTSQMTAQSSMCADPRRDVASESCCNIGWEQDSRKWHYKHHGYKFCEYNGERLSWEDANNRCAINGKEACTSLSWHMNIGGICTLDMHRQESFYSWTQKGCELEIKLSPNSEIAVVHRVEKDYNGQNRTWGGVDEDTMNFFKPAWYNMVPPGTDCSSIDGCYEDGEDCFCKVELVEEAAFSAAPSSLKLILEKCFTGAPNPASLGGYSEVSSSIDGVTVYSKDGSPSYGKDTIFKYVDEYGEVRFVKNLVSDVSIGGSGFKFRNPVQFLSFVDPELRDVYHELDAVIDSYFYHPSHAPFLAHNMLQRFGHSNPTPRFIEEVATAYKTGSYEGIGSGKYGDMGAMVAAILLGSESRSPSVAVDPIYGQLREPLLKVIALMRAMEYKHDSPLAVPLLDSLLGDIGQGSHEHPSVFSFFLSEFSPDGVVGNAGLVSPEAQVLAGKKVTELLEGLMKLVKNGLDACDGGFQWYRPVRHWWDGCSRTDGDVSKSYGYLHYENNSDDIDVVVDELSTLLTAGRLSDTNRELVKIASEDQFAYGDKKKATRAMIELMLSSSEFQTTSVARNSNEVRTPPVDDQPPTKEYKAVVFLMFNGGMDSWNMIIPTCGELYDQYASVRGDQLRLTLGEVHQISTTGQGACTTFGVNPQFRFAKDMYNAGDALFFVNTGVLRAPVDRFNYTMTGSRLFAHNWQQREVQKTDINNEFRTTGVGGRILDYLKKHGHKTSANSVDGGALLVRGSPVENNPVRLVSSGWPRTFNRYSTLETITDRIKQLNGETDPRENGLYGELWSTRLMQSFDENEESLKLVRNKDYEVPRFTKFRGWETGLERKFRAIASFMKSREFRKVDTEIYVLTDGGYDMHHGNAIDNKLRYVNEALVQFKDAMVAQGLWDNIVIVTGSDFGRTLVPNSNYGTDHAWAGHYFMMGGGLNGGKILGKYPEDITSTSKLRLGKRGRMVPTTSYSSIWNGIAQWMGVPEDALDEILPNRQNFINNCEYPLYTDKDLFTNGNTDPYCSTSADAIGI